MPFGLFLFRGWVAFSFDGLYMEQSGSMRIVCIQQSGQQLIQVVSIHWATVGEAEPLKPLFHLVGVGLQLGVQCAGIGVDAHVVVVENDQYVEVGFEKIVERFV